MSAGGIFDRLTRAIDGLLRNNDLARRESDKSRRNNDQIARLLQRQDANEPRLHEGPTLVQESQEKLASARRGLARAQHAFNVAQHSGQGVGAASKKLKRAERRVVHAEAGVLRSEAALTGAQLSSQQSAEEEQRVREQQAQEQRQAVERQARERSPNFAVAAARFGTAGLNLFNTTMANPAAVVQAGQARGGAVGQAQQGLGLLAAGGQGQGGLGGAANLLSGAGSLVGMIPGVGQVGEAFLKLGSTVLESIDRMQKWSNQLHEANMQFAEFSGAMATVQAEQMVRDIELSQKRGDRRAESAEYLAESKSQLDRRAAKVEDFVGNINNYIVGTLDKALVKIIDVLTLGLLKDDDEASGGKGLNMNEWMAELSGWQQEEQEDRPPDMAPNNLGTNQFV